LHFATSLTKKTQGGKKGTEMGYGQLK